MIEFDRPRGKASKDGAKSDELDAVRAARETLGRNRLHEPRAHDGHREALRVHTVTRAGVVRARTAASNELKALVLTAPNDIRQELRHLTTRMLVKRCAAFRDTPQRPVAERCARNTMRSIARRIICFNDEVAVHDTAMKQLVDEAAPQLVDEPGIGHVTAAMFYIAWSHPGRCRNEAALPTTSGQRQDRHRLNRNGDRQLNNALRRRARSKPQPPGDPRLPRPATLRGQDRPRDPTLPQALHRTPSLAPPRAPTGTQNRCLTDIEESTRCSGCQVLFLFVRALHSGVWVPARMDEGHWSESVDRWDSRAQSEVSGRSSVFERSTGSVFQMGATRISAES